MNPNQRSDEHPCYPFRGGRRFWRTLGVILLVGALTTAHAANYYCDPVGGDDFIDGLSAATAFKTIQRAADLTASDIVIEGIIVEGNSADITYAQAKAVSEHHNGNTPRKDWACIATTNRNGISIRPHKTTLPMPHHITVRDCVVYLCPGAGIVTDRADYVTIAYNGSFSNCWWMIYAGSGMSVFHSFDYDTNTTTYRQIVRNNLTFGRLLLTGNPATRAVSGMLAGPRLRWSFAVVR